MTLDGTLHLQVRAIPMDAQLDPCLSKSLLEMSYVFSVRLGAHRPVRGQEGATRAAVEEHEPFVAARVHALGAQHPANGAPIEAPAAESAPCRLTNDASPHTARDHIVIDPYVQPSSRLAVA